MGWPSGHVKQFSMELLKLKTCIQNVFVRAPRGWEDTKMDTERWKATELRQLALYAGKIVLKGIVREQLYEHHTVLSGISFLLVCPRQANQYCYTIEELLVYIIAQGRHLYGDGFLVYYIQIECIKVGAVSGETSLGKT